MYLLCVSSLSHPPVHADIQSPFFFLTLNMIDKRVGKTVRCLFFAPVSIQTSVLFLAKALV